MCALGREAIAARIGRGFSSPERLRMGEGFLVKKLIPGQPFIRSRHIAGLQSKLLKHNISRHGNAHRLIEREVTVEPLPAKTAIRREHQLVGGDVFHSENCSRYHGSLMAVSSGRPHMLTL